MNIVVKYPQHRSSPPSLCVCSLRLSPIETNLLLFGCSLLCVLSFIPLLRSVSPCFVHERRKKAAVFFFFFFFFFRPRLYVRVRSKRERERKNCLSVYVFDLSCSCVCVFTIAHSVSSVIYIARDEKKKYSNKNEKKASSSVLWDPLSLCQGETGSVPGYFLIGGSFALGSGRVGERWPRIAFIGTGTLRRCGGWR